MAAPPPVLLDHDPPHRDPLYGANARPAAPGGVPFNLTMTCVCIIMVLALVSFHPGPIALAIPGWPLLQWWINGDYSKPGIVLGYARGAARTVNMTLWGGSTVAPAPAGRISIGIPRHVALPKDREYV